MAKESATRKRTKWACFFLGHLPLDWKQSDTLVYEKGDSRNVVAFAGELGYCECGKEFFIGESAPWFNGTADEFAEFLMKTRGENYANGH